MVLTASVDCEVRERCNNSLPARIGLLGDSDTLLAVSFMLS